MQALPSCSSCGFMFSKKHHGRCGMSSLAGDLDFRVAWSGCLFLWMTYQSANTFPSWPSYTLSISSYIGCLSGGRYFLLCHLCCFAFFAMIIFSSKYKIDNCQLTGDTIMCIWILKVWKDLHYMNGPSTERLRLWSGAVILWCLPWQQSDLPVAMAWAQGLNYCPGSK